MAVSPLAFAGPGTTVSMGMPAARVASRAVNAAPAIRAVAPSPSPLASLRAVPAKVGYAAIGTVGRAGGFFGSLVSLSFMGSMAAGIFGFLSKTPLIGKPFGYLATLAGTPNRVMETVKVEDLLHAPSRGLDSLQRLTENKLPRVSGQLARAATGSVKLEKDAGKYIGGIASNVADSAARLAEKATLTTSGDARAWYKPILNFFTRRNGADTTTLGNTVRALPNEAARMSTYQAAYIGMIAASNITQAASTGISLLGQVRAIRYMYKAGLPIKSGVWSMFKDIGAKLGVQALFLAIQTGMVGRGNGGMGGKMALGGIIAAQMAANPIANYLSSGNVLPQLGVMHEAQAKGQRLDAGSYAALICLASRDARDAGQENALVGAMAQHYAAQQTLPTQILKDINSGAFTALATKLEAERKAAIQAAAPESEQSTQPDVKQAVGPNTERVLNSAQTAAAKPVIGDVTAQLAKAAQPDHVMAAGAGRV